MAAVANIGSIADFAYNRIDGVTTAISGTVMQQFATQAVYSVENWTGASITTTAIDQKYVPLLTELTVAMTLARMHGIGVDFNWALGEFSVQKGTGASTEALQVDLALKNAERELQSLGRPNRVYATFYG